MFERGMKTRREVLGDEHVDRASEKTSELDADFQRWITEMAWGGVWSRAGTRSRHAQPHHHRHPRRPGT